MADEITINVNTDANTAVVTTPAATAPVLVVTQEVLIREYANATIDGGIIN